VRCALAAHDVDGAAVRVHARVAVELAVPGLAARAQRLAPCGALLLPRAVAADEHRLLQEPGRAGEDLDDVGAVDVGAHHATPAAIAGWDVADLGIAAPLRAATQACAMLPIRKHFRPSAMWLPTRRGR